MSFKRARLLGCVAGAVLFSASAGNAASVAFVTDSGFGGQGSFAFNASPTLIAGELNSATNVAFGSNWMEFIVLPPPAPTVNTGISVNVLASPTTGTPSFTGETYQLGSAPGLGDVIGSMGVTGVPVTVALTIGVPYFLQFASTGVIGLGESPFQVSVSGSSSNPTPIPGALVLFGSVLAGAGVLMRRRGERGPATTCAA